MPIRAVIFDCDGVLVDSVSLAAEVLADYLRELGFEVSPAEARRRFGSGKMAEYVARFEAEVGRPLPANFERELRARREIVFRTRLRAVAGAAQLLEEITLPSCVASNGPQAQIEHSLRVVGLIQHFPSRIFSAYTVRAWKPDPQLFLHAARALGTAPDECAVVEDTEIGLQAAVAAGMHAFAYFPEGGLPRHSSVRTLRRLQELAAHLAAD